eukprot:6442827-Pyramimonas_sp.AAC.1
MRAASRRIRSRSTTPPRPPPGRGCSPNPTPPRLSLQRRGPREGAWTLMWTGCQTPQTPQTRRYSGCSDIWCDLDVDESCEDVNGSGVDVNGSGVDVNRPGVD